jgi:predicted ATPase/DNA-binding CsgD family transcriptional regulator
LHDPLNTRENEILQRLANGLSDQQIADDLFLSPNTVKWYNRQLYSKLGVTNRTQAIVVAQQNGLVDNARPSPALPASGHNLPAPTSLFIGRDREIAEVEQLLSESRLLTLTGTGGTGKTRLALRVATEVSVDFRDGAYFVDLAPLSHHTLVPKAIAGALDVFENPGEPLLDTLKRVLYRRELLLLIDNFEHVIEAAPLISELLWASAHLKVLITSREPLRISGEQEYPVPALSLPVAEAVSVQSLVDSEAGLLFVKRAQLTWPQFEVKENNAPAIAQICTRLDGLPLAIELAAARSKMLSPQALLERLGATSEASPLRTLTSGSRDAPPRQRTLRDSIEWSYNLLDDNEKILFMRLATFRGGCSLEAVEAICGEGLTVDVLDALASLVDKNLVRQIELLENEPRFFQLETIREYASERLEVSGEAERMRQQHTAYFLELAERAEPEFRLARYDYWCRRLDLELDNLRATFEWTLNAGDLVLGVRLASALCLFWYGKGYHVEAIRWLEPLQARLGTVPLTFHPKFLMAAAHMTWFNDMDKARHMLTRALDISRELGDKLQTAWALTFLSYTWLHEPQSGFALGQESLALFRELGFQPGIAQSLNCIGELARVSGADEYARRTYEECMVVSQITGETRRICYMCTNLAFLAQHEGNHKHAIELSGRSLLLARERQDKRDIADALATLAGSIGPLGQLQPAVRLISAAHAVFERIGTLPQPSDKPEYDRIIAQLRSQLDEASFQAAWAEGQTMTLDLAVESALQAIGANHVS